MVALNPITVTEADNPHQVQHLTLLYLKQKVCLTIAAKHDAQDTATYGAGLMGTAPNSTVMAMASLAKKDTPRTVKSRAATPRLPPHRPAAPTHPTASLKIAHKRAAPAIQT